MNSSRAFSLGSIALVGVLSASLGLWSAFSGPKIADVALHDAAANLAAAQSFVIELHQTESVVGTDEQVQIGEVVHFEAPDRQWAVQTVDSSNSGNSANSHSVKKITQIGDSCWISTTGTATPFPCEVSSIQHLLGNVKKLETVSGVTNDGGTYVLSKKDSASLVSSEASGQLTLGMAKVKVRISGDYVSSEQLSLDAAVDGASILINEVLNISDVGTGPRVIAPSGPPTETAAQG
jgi:hypothetical protein